MRRPCRWKMQTGRPVKFRPPDFFWACQEFALNGCWHRVAQSPRRCKLFFPAEACPWSPLSCRKAFCRDVASHSHVCRWRLSPMGPDISTRMSVLCIAPKSFRVGFVVLHAFRQATEVWDSCVLDNSHCGEMVPNSFCEILRSWKAPEAPLQQRNSTYIRHAEKSHR